MSDRATLEAIRDEHQPTEGIPFMGLRFKQCKCGVIGDCPARTAAEIGLALADEKQRALDGWEACDESRKRLMAERDAARADADRLAERAYWFYRAMVVQGGPDGSELEQAITEDLEESLASILDPAEFPLAAHDAP
jgi:hypothetical protein